MPSRSARLLQEEAHLHASQRFLAPSSIETGTPLKNLLDRRFVCLLAESFADVHAGFNARRFQAAALRGLDELALIPRAAHIARALVEALPPGAAAIAAVLSRSFGPELKSTAGNGLAPFFYLPHSHVVATACIDDFEAGLQANHELTRRFTAEFSIRPYIVREQERTLAQLEKWARDPNAHVRRLVSEGTRPRLPWAMRLKAIQADPGLTLPLLERLKDDAELYVRRSVANHLADILKDHPQTVWAVCERWRSEVSRKSVTDERRAARHWMIRHAVRLPAKKGDAQALRIRDAAK